jgi:hypothetical protein
MVDHDKYIVQTIHILNLAEVDLMEISEADRSRTLKLEMEMTEAVNSGDTENFFNLLDDWRCILMRGGGGEKIYQREAA